MGQITRNPRMTIAFPMKSEECWEAWGSVCVWGVMDSGELRSGHGGRVDVYQHEVPARERAEVAYTIRTL